MIKEPVQDTHPELISTDIVERDLLLSTAIILFALIGLTICLTSAH